MADADLIKALRALIAAWRRQPTDRGFSDILRNAIDIDDHPEALIRDVSVSLGVEVEDIDQYAKGQYSAGLIDQLTVMSVIEAHLAAP